MARGDQLNRQWSILHRLQQGRRSRRALADEFQVSRKTIARDIDALSMFPITEERDGIDVYYEMMRGSKAPGVWFDAEEVTALIFAKDAVQEALSNTSYQQAFASAIQKVEGAQRGHAYRQKRQFPDVYQMESPTSRYVRRFEEDLLPQIIQAALENRCVEILYFTSSRETFTRRKVEPFVLYQGRFGLRLIAYCHYREAMLWFNVNQIRELLLLDETFPLEARRFDLETFLLESYGGMRSAPIVDVRLFIKYPTAHWARDRNFHETQELIEHEDGIEVRFRAGGLPAIAASVLGLGVDCIALSPPELRDLVAERARQIAKHYET
ncbi:MAG: hypothetical protein CL920_22955 [Deltaproteobacteria bacterium]|nr:hypothetical protein [Deltaproteobacteria bacterium]|tara:strand:+ start:5275 stop:6249 length:975 start_codon:yes stop_codon:yes gene_type:complete